MAAASDVPGPSSQGTQGARRARTSSGAVEERGWGNNLRAGVVGEGVVVEGTVSPGLTYCLQGRSFG
ncbi:hypothetical protein GCM10010266_68050 [Streptomyces griseomycini]|nr:hypothetical protein GCM10010266_68050 [Streptomyces griseomycini]